MSGKTNEKKVVKLTEWGQMKAQKKTGEVIIPGIETDFSVEIQGMSPATIESINEKYEDMKAQIPEPQVFVKELKKFIKAESGPEYEKYQKQIRAIENLRMAELALGFLVIKPDGTFEEQVKQLKDDLLFAQLPKIVEGGLKLSGIEVDEKEIEDAKNS